MRARNQGVVTDAVASSWVALAMVAALVAGCAAPRDEVAGARVGEQPLSAALTSESVVVGDDRSLEGQVEPAASGTFRLVIVGDVATDPVAASPVDPADMAVLDLLYDGLTRWDGEAGTWVPELAVAVEADRLAQRWTFTLGEHRFGDGRPITAGDVVASIERVRGSSALAASRFDHVGSVQAIEEATVEIVLSQPDAAFPALLSHPLFGVTPAVAADEMLDGRVGSGPLEVSAADAHRLVSRSTGEAGDLVEVEIVRADDLDTGLALVRSGAADLIHVPPTYDGTVDGAAASGVTVAYALNVSAPTLASPESRARVIDAIDTGVVAAALPGLLPIETVRSGAGSEVVGSLPEALSVTLVRSLPAGAEAAMAASLSGQWGAAGVDVTVEELSLERFVAAVGRGAHEVIRTGWVEMYPGDRPHWLLLDATSEANVTGVADTALTSQMRHAASSGDPEALRVTEAAIVEQAALVPIGRLETRIVTAVGVEGVTVRGDGSLVFEL